MTLLTSSGQQSLPRQDLGQRQETHLEAVEVRTQHLGSGRSGGHQPAQLCHHGQLLHGQAGLHGGPRLSGADQRRGDPDLAGPGPR